MVTYNMRTAFAKFNGETLSQAVTGINLKLASIWDTDLYYKIDIANQGNLSWTFDDGSTEKTGTLGAGANVSQTLNFATSNIPTETTKDTVQLKITYYKNSDYTGEVSNDTINVDIYFLVQQNGTWGSSTYSEDTVLFDKLEGDYTTIDNLANFDLLLGKASISSQTSGIGNYATVDTGVVNQYSLKYYHSSSLDWGWRKLYIKDKATGNDITDKIVFLTLKGGSGTRRVYILHNGRTFATYDIPSTWKKLILPLGEGDTMYIYVYGGYHQLADVEIDSIYIFNPF